MSVGRVIDRDREKTKGRVEGRSSRKLGVAAYSSYPFHPPPASGFPCACLVPTAGTGAVTVRDILGALRHRTILTKTRGSSSSSATIGCRSPQVWGTCEHFDGVDLYLVSII
jgi:hypothetical protein